MSFNEEDNLPDEGRATSSPPRPRRVSKQQSPVEHFSPLTDKFANISLNTDGPELTLVTGIFGGCVCVCVCR